MTPRDAEIARYVALYREHGTAYRPTAKRLELYRALVAERPDLYDLGLIDVGAGQGDMLDEAKRLGIWPRAGTEVVPALCEKHGFTRAPAWDLVWPRAFGTATCFDVLEHLLPDDVPTALRELARVAKRRILIEVSCRPSNWRDAVGQLHMTIWTPDEWLTAARAAWPGWTVTRREDRPTEHGAAVFEAVPAASPTPAA